MRRKMFCLIIVISTCLSVGAQENNDLIGQADALILNAKFEEALILLDKHPADVSPLLIANKKAEALTRLGRLEEAGNIIEDVRTQLARKPDPALEGITNSNLAFLHLSQGRQDLAEELLNQALATLGQNPEKNQQQIAHAHSFLGLVYVSQGKYAQAQEHLHRTLAIRQTHGKAWVAATYNDLGLAYSQTDKDRALDYYEQAHKIYRELYGERDPRIAIANINTGILYRDLELFGDAIVNFETALKISNDILSQPHPAKAIALYNLGQTYLQLNDQHNAAQYYEQALKMYKACFGSKHPEVASVLNAMGNLRLAQDQFDEALGLYQDALQANVPDFKADDPTANPTLRNYYNGIGLLHTLLFKAQAFEAKYSRKSLKFSDLTEALTILSYCDTLIDQLRQHTTNESDKLALGVMANEVYADGVRIAYEAALNAFRKEPYYEKAFYFAEKSKGAVLLEAISDTRAKSFAGVPDALLEEEKELRSALASVARKLAEKPAEEEERALRETDFSLRKKYDAFIAKLEQEYPAYFNLKFNVAAPTVAELQTLLPPQTAIISYFIDDKNQQLYTFFLRNSQYKVSQQSLSADFNRYINGLRNGLYFQEIEAYKTSAYQLGKTLIPNIPKSINDLVILPTGRLGLIPFETLLTSDPAGINDYRSLPYLIKKHEVRYEFSAGLLTQKRREGKTSPGPSIFLCAPVRFPDNPTLSDLPGTQQEVKDISALFAGKDLATSALLFDQAAEQQIKSGMLKDYRYLHFATHGRVNEVDPELSSIFLRQDDTDDGNLFAGEIYNLELNAGLVTLSACQTGLGKLIKGEGVIGLSRALVYAGAQNILVSFWSVADQSTAMIMENFYKHLLDNGNEEFSRALRQSKLALAAHKEYAPPYYWAPFVLIGF